MRLFWELTKLSIRRQITYRAATLAGLSTNFFFGLLRAALMVALFGARQEMDGITLQGAVTYTGVSQASIAFLSLFSWWDVMQSIYTGQIATDLLKPMHFYLFWLAQDLGRALVNLVLRGLTIIAFYAVVFDITTPTSTEQWLALIITLFLSWMVSFSWRFLLNLVAFWTPNATGIMRLGFTLSWFLSGFLMPLRFFPEWFIRICYLTPFPHTVNAIVEVYLGLQSRNELITAMLNQVVWIFLLITAGQLVLRSGVRRLVIQGG